MTNNLRDRLHLKLLLALGVLATALPGAAQGLIYRCHAQNGDLLFQDKPCNTVSGTREAQAHLEGEVVAVTPTPSVATKDAPTAAENYTRYLDFVSRDRREQQAVDAGETARLRARADEAERSAAAASRTSGTPRVVPGCQLFGPDGECVTASSYY